MAERSPTSTSRSSKVHKGQYQRSLIFSSMVKSGNSASRVLLILCNLTVCTEGRTAMLDANAVECLVGLLRRSEFDSEATRENCVGNIFLQALACSDGAVPRNQQHLQSGRSTVQAGLTSMMLVSSTVTILL